MRQTKSRLALKAAVDVLIAQLGLHDPGDMDVGGYIASDALALAHQAIRGVSERIDGYEILSTAWWYYIFLSGDTSHWAIPIEEIHPRSIGGSPFEAYARGVAKARRWHLKDQAA